MKIQFLLAEKQPWADKGYVQMEEQLPVSEASPAPSVASAQQGRVAQPTVEGNLVKVSGKGYEMTFDKLTGRLNSLNYGGQTIIKPGFGPKLDAFRARTDNDNWMDYRWPQLGLHNLKDKATAFAQQLTKDGTLRLSFTVESQAPYGGHDNYSNRDRNPETALQDCGRQVEAFRPR